MNIHQGIQILTMVQSPKIAIGCKHDDSLHTGDKESGWVILTGLETLNKSHQNPKANHAKRTFFSEKAVFASKSMVKDVN